jgi:hypothetical protein
VSGRDRPKTDPHEGPVSGTPIKGHAGLVGRLVCPKFFVAAWLTMSTIGKYRLVASGCQAQHHGPAAATGIELFRWTKAMTCRVSAICDGAFLPETRSVAPLPSRSRVGL